MAPTPTFGNKLPDLVYRPRPGAYALVFDAAGRVAVVFEEGEWYLPGGGIEAGETPELALQREIDEECACGVHIDGLLGDAIEYVINRRVGPLEVQARYFRARFVGPSTAEWLAPDDACARVRRKSDAWAIGSARSSTERAPAAEGPSL